MCGRVALALVLGLLAVISPSANSSRIGGPSDNWCEFGTTFLSGCHLCVCGNDGKPAYCKPFFCQEEEARLDLEPCVPGETIKVKCNTCSCGLDRKPIGCTKKKCIRRFDNSNKNKNYGLEKNEEYYKSGPKCVPGTTLMVHCNTCVCDNNGKPTDCTKMKCHPVSNIGVQTCVPGAVVTIHCERCKCSSGGILVGCTKKHCKNRPVPMDVNGGTCVPGTTYKDDCNTCICSDDGKSGACTLKQCVPKIGYARKKKRAGIFTEENKGRNQVIETGVSGKKKRAGIFTDRRITRCSPGKLFSSDCDLCLCGKDGIHYVCSPDFMCKGWRRRRTSEVSGRRSPSAELKIPAHVEMMAAQTSP